MIDNNINPIHSPCKNCVFAIYENNTQTGCSLNYLDKYKNKNVSILEAYDDDKEFYIINGKKCLGYRENKWFDQFNLSDASIEDKTSKYFETNTLDYCVIIDLKTMDINNLDHILSQLSQCQIQPKKVIIVRYVDNELQFGYSKIEALLKKYNASYIWRIQTIVDLSLTSEQILHNIVSLNAKYRFILSINKANSDIQHIINSTNIIVHEDLDQFEILSNRDRSCMIFSSIVYRFDAFHGHDLLAKDENYKTI